MFLAHEYDNLRFLKKMNLSHNQIEAVPEIPQQSLNELDMSHNVVSSAREFKGHNTIQSFNLENNKLVSTEGLRKMPLLKELNLSNNQIECIEHIREVPVLSRLLLKNNPIESCSSFSAELQSVTFLDLSNTKIQKKEDL